eukprot:807504-Prorocentrum_minimum.AAC.1
MSAGSWESLGFISAHSPSAMMYTLSGTFPACDSPNRNQRESPLASHYITCYVVVRRPRLGCKKGWDPFADKGEGANNT